MKKTILSTAFLTLALSLNAQVAIEKETADAGAILDFPDVATKGILLPNVNNYNTAGEEPGTLVFNSDDKKVYYRGNSGWKELTNEGEKTVTVDSGLSEADGKGLLITDKSTSQKQEPKGVLELNSETKALALPKVADVTKIPSPKSGTICFDLKTESLAIFNGAKWHFWR